MWLVVRELEEPGLREMPKGMCCQGRRVGSIEGLLARKRPVVGGEVGLGDFVG